MTTKAAYQTCNFTMDQRAIAWRDGRMLDHGQCNHLPEVTSARYVKDEPTTEQRLEWATRQSPKDGWVEVRTSFYNELLQDHKDLRNVVERLLGCAREDHASHHGSIFIYDTDKACCDRGQAIIDAERILLGDYELRTVKNVLQG